MNQRFRTTQKLVVSALLLSAVAMAQATAKKTDTAGKEHHSKMSKVAFWRHHNEAKKDTKQHAAKPASAKQTQSKQAQVKPVAAKQSQASKAQVKPISAKQPASKAEPKQNTTKAASPFTTKSAAKAPSEQAKKPQQKSTTAKNAPALTKDSAKQ